MIRKRTPLQPSTELYEDNPFAPKTTYFPRTAGDIEANDKMEAAALAAGAFNESDLALNAIQSEEALYDANPFAPKTTYFPRTAGDIEANDKMEAAALAAGAFNESDLALNALQRDEALMREQQLDSVTFRTEG